MFVVNRVRSFFGGLPFFNEVTRVARFITVPGSEGGFTVPDPAAPLPVSDRHIQDIDAPGLVSGSVSVIYYRTTHSQNPSFSVRLNSTRLTVHTLQGDGPFSWHEIIPGGALKAEDNELTLAISGNGTVTFSDIVILYQSDQTTVKEEPVFDPG